MSQQQEQEYERVRRELAKASDFNNFSPREQAVSVGAILLAEGKGRDEVSQILQAGSDYFKQLANDNPAEATAILNEAQNLENTLLQVQPQNEQLER
jgi:cellobiose-specific phosphotransferase system component IIA